MSTPFYAFAIESVTCSEVRLLDSSSPEVSANANVTYSSVISHGYSLQKVGVANGVDQYQLTDAKYGTLNSFYTLEVRDNILTFVSAQEELFSLFKTRIVVLNGPNSGQSYSQHAVAGGVEGPGGGLSVENFVYQKCDVQ